MRPQYTSQSQITNFSILPVCSDGGGADHPDNVVPSKTGLAAAAN
jgi:hypothetical protein